MVVDLQQVRKFWEENPLWSGESAGKSYGKNLLCGHAGTVLAVEELFYHFFPARALPFRIPRRLHRWIDAHSGFMIYALVRKKPCVE